MKIVLSGVETNNKGAELMLYAILQEIERRFPDAKVYLPYFRIIQGIGYIKTELDFRYTPYSKCVYKYHLRGILSRLHIPQKYLWNIDIVNDADWFIDGSGFLFSDQWNIKGQSIYMWQYKLKTLHQHGCKIVFLPQAFGPAELPNTKKIFTVLSNYADIIIPRESVSFNYLKKSGVVNMGKVKQYSDFTSLVKGVFPARYEHLKNGVCIIPNMRMIDKGTISYDDYIKLISSIIKECRNSGHLAYLLNHEGPKDAELCYKVKESIGDGIYVVTDLNALEVKGVIASAYLVITSRFHGLASALNSCVPSLATSWSHKYEELFRDYNITDSVLPLDDFNKAEKKVRQLLDNETNTQIRENLQIQVSRIKEQTREMWNEIWNL